MVKCAADRYAVKMITRNLVSRNLNIFSKNF